MYLTKVTLYPDHYPTDRFYPFNIPTLRGTSELTFKSPVTFFVGENGTGKSTLLKALCQKCGIHIWRRVEGARLETNLYEEALYKFIEVEWSNGRVPGSFFGSETFRDFAQCLDEWATADPEMDWLGFWVRDLRIRCVCRPRFLAAYPLALGREA